MVGAIVGLVAGIALVALAVMVPPLAPLAVALGVGLMTVAYIGGAASVGSGFGDFMRGFSIGLNAGINAMVGSMVFGPVVGIALGVVGFLAAFDGIAGDRGGAYQSVLGWSSWLMPMSWLANALGLGVFLINRIAAGVGSGRPGAAAQINGYRIDWATGTIITHGGWLTPVPGGYNLGNFVHVNANSRMTPSLLQHEIGHGLNVAAFGSIWHLVGAWDQNVGPNGGRDANAYAEHLAESHVDSTLPGAAFVPLWARMWS